MTRAMWRRCLRSWRVLPGIAVWLTLFHMPLARAVPEATVTYKVRAGDTLEAIAAEYYGDRNDALFLMLANRMIHPRPLRPGEVLKIPVSRELTTAPGDSLESLAAKFLGDAKRGRFLAEFNGLPRDASLAAGETVSIPFQVTHTAARVEKLSAIAVAYYGEAKAAALLGEYNFITTGEVRSGQTIDVPIHQVRVRASKLPPTDEEARARTAKRLATTAEAARALAAARAGFRAGDFGVVKKALAGIDVDYLDNRSAAAVGVLLGISYVAFRDEDSALVTFKKVLERSPSITLDAYTYSPRFLTVWQRAGGRVEPAR